VRAGTTVPGVLHPVGDLPAGVYWRRRLLILAVLLAVLGGVGWLGFTLLARGDGASASAAASTGSSRTPARVPALDRVVPSVSGIATPTPPQSAAATTTAPAGPAPGGPCTDDMLAVTVSAPATAAPGSKPTFELVVQNTSAVPCVRALDKGLQELILLDSAGNRVWGSNDCFPEASSDTRTLAPGETVSFPVVWSGLTSEPTCTAARTTPAPGNYVLRGRLDTRTSADTSISLG
jgi:hypothetical protein